MDFWTIIADLGMPIAAAVACGVFIMIVINYILSSIVGSIDFIKNVIESSLVGAALEVVKNLGMPRDRTGFNTVERLAKVYGRDAGMINCLPANFVWGDGSLVSDWTSNSFMFIIIINAYSINNFNKIRLFKSFDTNKIKNESIFEPIVYCRDKNYCVKNLNNILDVKDVKKSKFFPVL